MEVAFNNCFGGFGLSCKALTEFARKKGIKLTWYNQTGYAHNNNEEYIRISGIPKDNSFSLTPLKKDCGEKINKLDNGLFYYPDFDSTGSRSDIDLIETIEKLGEEANGLCASLSITEIPNGASFEIDEYDGNESIVPPRQSW